MFLNFCLDSLLNRNFRGHVRRTIIDIVCYPESVMKLENIRNKTKRGVVLNFCRELRSYRVGF